MKRQFFLSVGMLFLVTAGLYGGVVVPSVLSIKDTRADIGVENAKIQDRYVRRGQLKDSLRDLQEVRGGVASLMSIGIREGQELEFVKALENAAAESGVVQDLQLRTADQQEISAWERTVPVTIKVEGGYADVLRFLKLLEVLPYYINVSSFSVRSLRPSGTAAAGAGAIRVELAGSVYWVTDAVPAFIGEVPL